MDLGRDESIEKLLLGAATRGEVLLSAGRALFCLLVLVRFAAISASWSDPHVLSRSLWTVPVVLLGIVFSGVVIYRFARDRPLRGWFAGSVVLDVAVCFGALLPNVLYPGDLYRGILIGPDVYAVLIVVFASGLRLSVRLALLSGALAMTATATLITFDFTVGRVEPRYEWVQPLMFLLLLFGATAVAAITAYRTSALALMGARNAQRHEHARRELQALLHGHHDAHSLLGSLMLKVDRVLSRDVARDLRDDLDVLRDCVRQVQVGAAAGLLIADHASPLEIGGAVTDIVGRLSSTYPHLALGSRPREALWARFVGGPSGLHRVLHNLVKNAAEGDGRSRASRIVVRVLREDAEVVLQVDDDGPGLRGDPASGTSKPDGSGVGLQAVRTIVEESGGKLVFSDSPQGGAAVGVRLPLAAG